jgi:predicted nucleotide-binding protein (sugar kinase/HSP70/actin superfamily)
MKKLDLKKLIKEIILEQDQIPVDVSRVKPLVKDLSQTLRKINVLQKEDNISMYLKDASEGLTMVIDYLNDYIKVHKINKISKNSIYK